MITVKINVSKIQKERLVKGEKGVYLDLVMFEKKSAPGEYLVKQSTSKEEREARVEMPIIGSAKTYGPKPRPATSPADSPASHEPSDDPFGGSSPY